MNFTNTRIRFVFIYYIVCAFIWHFSNGFVEKSSLTLNDPNEELVIKDINITLKLTDAFDSMYLGHAVHVIDDMKKQSQSSSKSVSKYFMEKMVAHRESNFSADMVLQVENCLLLSQDLLDFEREISAGEVVDAMIKCLKEKVKANAAAISQLESLGSKLKTYFSSIEANLPKEPLSDFIKAKKRTGLSSEAGEAFGELKQFFMWALYGERAHSGYETQGQSLINAKLLEKCDSLLMARTYTYGSKINQILGEIEILKATEILAAQRKTPQQIKDMLSGTSSNLIAEVFLHENGEPPENPLHLVELKFRNSKFVWN